MGWSARGMEISDPLWIPTSWRNEIRFISIQTFTWFCFISFMSFNSIQVGNQPCVHLARGQLVTWHHVLRWHLSVSCTHQPRGRQWLSGLCYYFLTAPESLQFAGERTKTLMFRLATPSTKNVILNNEFSLYLMTDGRKSFFFTIFSPKNREISSLR